MVAPDGTLILYERGGDDGYRVTDLFTISAGGESRTRLSDTPRRWEAFPDWQPLVTG